MTDIRKNLIIRTNGKVEPIEINGYKGLKEAVGGLIEACIGGDDYTLWANEEGRLMGLPMNQVAREFVAEMKQIPISNVLSLHGDMVLAGCDGEGGDTDTPEHIRIIAEGLSMFDEPQSTLITEDEDGNITKEWIG